MAGVNSVRRRYLAEAKKISVILDNKFTVFVRSAVTLKTIDQNYNAILSCKNRKNNAKKKRKLFDKIKNRIKNYHCARAQREAKKERKKRLSLLLFFFLFSPSKLPRDFFCCNPSKKDSLDKIKTSQSI